MKDMVWYFKDKSKWGAGAWQDEPDKMQWVDTATGLPCLIVRNNMGTLCGYVGVSASHPDFERDYNDVDVNVHGGLTFSSHCSLNKEHGICHLVEPGEDDNVWWFGFDCGHCQDFSPGIVSVMSLLGIRHAVGPLGEVYRDVAYVQGEIAELARQLKEKAE